MLKKCTGELESKIGLAAGIIKDLCSIIRALESERNILALQLLEVRAKLGLDRTDYRPLRNSARCADGVDLLTR